MVKTFQHDEKINEKRERSMLPLHSPPSVIKYQKKYYMVKLFTRDDVIVRSVSHLLSTLHHSYTREEDPYSNETQSCCSLLNLPLRLVRRTLVEVLFIFFSSFFSTGMRDVMYWTSGNIPAPSSKEKKASNNSFISSCRL